MSNQLSLDPESVRVVARQRYSEQRVRDDAACYADPNDVARLAAGLARRFYNGSLGLNAPGQVALAKYSGLLVYAMERWGYTFDGVVDVAEFSVARVVSGLSADCRLPQSKRLVHHCASLAESDATAQLVKLAEIIATAIAVEGLTDEELDLHGDTLCHRAEGNRLLLAAMSHLCASPRMTQVLAETRAKLDGVAALVDAARRTRREASRPRVTATPI